MAAFVPRDACWANGIFPIFIDPGRGRSPPAALSLGRVGFHCSLAGNISSSRMLCLSEACFLFLVLTNTLASIRCAVSLPLLDGPSRSLPLFPPLSRSFFFSSPLSPSVPPSLPLPSQLSSVTLSNETQSSGLTRLLGVAFPGEKDKQEWESEQAEARRRDHRRIGTVSASYGGFVLFASFARSCQFAGRHRLKMSCVGSPPAPNVHRVHSKQLYSAAGHSCREGGNSNPFVSVVAVPSWSLASKITAEVETQSVLPVGGGQAKMCNWVTAKTQKSSPRFLPSVSA